RTCLAHDYVWKDVLTIDELYVVACEVRRVFWSDAGLRPRRLPSASSLPRSSSGAETLAPSREGSIVQASRWAVWTLPVRGVFAGLRRRGVRGNRPCRHGDH